MDDQEYTIRPFNAEDEAQVVELISRFRVDLALLKDVEREADLPSAAEELQTYLERGYSIFVADLEGRIVGYLVVRAVEEVVWAESLFVLPTHRRRGVGSSLYARAEAIAWRSGSDYPYNWIHPNNDAIIAFLKKRGYHYLNLIELRHGRPGEGRDSKIRVGDHEFVY
jgi:GNAT superfamily N-acetyltransferase